VNIIKLTRNEIATEKSPSDEGTSHSRIQPTSSVRSDVAWGVSFLKLSLLFILFSNLQCTSRTADFEIPGHYALTENSKVETRRGVTYVNDKAFSGWMYSLFPSGDTSYVQSFLNGKAHGVSKRWYDNNQKEETRYYLNGKNEGHHIGWWENGQMKYEYHFVNDVYEGEFKEWYVTGQPYKIFHYVKGQENGLQQVWERDGKIRSNYEIRNGRLFGLMGPRPCASLWENDSTVVQSH
jgi:antitoxin component YwqK of YwqJK toxin-antitoxin module